MTDQDTRTTDRTPNGRAEAVGLSNLPIAFRITSFSDVLALLGTLGGSLYFYSRAYNAVFLPSFGLSVGVVPMSVQDAMVDGLEGVTINILYLWVPMATAFLLYFLWTVASRFFEPEQPTSLSSAQPSPETWWARRREKVRRDVGVSRLLTLLLSIIAAPAVLVLAVVIIAIPAEISARKDVAALRALVAGACAKCATYDLGTKKVIGRAVASTADRIFVLGRDGLVMPITLDDLQSVRPARNR